MTSLSLILVVMGTTPPFVQPQEFTDPLQIPWIRSNDNLEGPAYLPWFPGIAFEHHLFPWIPNLSLMHGTFWIGSLFSPQFRRFQPDTSRPMTYLFSTRGTWEYSHVGALFGRDLGRFRIHAGADFKTFQRTVPVTSHNAWLYARIRGYGTPTFSVFRADQTREQEQMFRILTMTWAPSWATLDVVRWDTEKGGGWTLTVGQIFRGATLEMTQLPRASDRPFFAFRWAFRTQGIEATVGAASMNNRVFPDITIGYQTPSGEVVGFSKAFPLWNPEDSLHAITMPRQIGIRGRWTSTHLQVYALLQNAWDQWVYAGDRYTYRPKLRSGYLAVRAKGEVGALTWDLWGTLYAWDDAHSYATSSALGGEIRWRLTWREGRIQAMPSLQGAWVTDPVEKFRLDAVGEMVLFESVLLDLRVVQTWAFPAWTPDDLRYTLLISVRLPD